MTRATLLLLVLCGAGLACAAWPALAMHLRIAGFVWSVEMLFLLALIECARRR
jgi:hypothetical protein